MIQPQGLAWVSTREENLSSVEPKGLSNLSEVRLISILEKSVHRAQQTKVFSPLHLQGSPHCHPSLLRVSQLSSPPPVIFNHLSGHHIPIITVVVVSATKHISSCGSLSKLQIFKSLRLPRALCLLITDQTSISKILAIANLSKFQAKDLKSSYLPAQMYLY